MYMCVTALYAAHMWCTPQLLRLLCTLEHGYLSAAVSYYCALPAAATQRRATPYKQLLHPAADEAVKQPMGKRSAVVGFVTEVANTLLQAADPSNQDQHCAALAAVLQSSEEWQGSIEQQGSIHSLLQVRSILVSEHVDHVARFCSGV
jgi:hypothetical protein